jgi:Na+/H+ antiporter NhaD/arsenite permease-like protein
LVSIAEVLIVVFFLLTLLLIIFERIPKTLAAMLGAGLCLLVAITPGSAEDGGVIIPDIEHLLELVEMDLLLVIIGITLMVGVARGTGLFDYIAVVIIKKSGHNQYVLLVALSLLTLVFSAFLDAYMAIIIVASITIVACDALDINPKPFILAEAIFGDLGGTMTRIASPPNLIIGGHFDVNFLDFLALTAPYVAVATLVTLFIWGFLFRSYLSKEISEIHYNEILLIDEKIMINNQKDFILASIIFVLTIVGFTIAPYLPMEIELGYIALAGGFIMVGFVGENVEKSLEKVEWPIVFFLVGLLTIVGIAEKAHILEILAIPIEFLFELNLLGGLVALQWINAIASAALDNVPVASVMTSVMDTLLSHYPSLNLEPLLVSVVIGTNLGGNITPIGSASTVQAVSILKRSENPSATVSFKEFVKYGGFVTFFQLLIGSFYIYLIWLINL